jgi:hypothetical protein
MLPGPNGKSQLGAGGSWWKERPSAVARTERVQFTSTSADGWPEKTCGRQPNLRHHLRGDGRSLGSVAGQRRGGQSGNGMQGGSVVKPRDDKPAVSEIFLPWSRRQLSAAGRGPVVVKRAKSMRRRLELVGEKWR